MVNYSIGAVRYLDEDSGSHSIRTLYIVSYIVSFAFSCLQSARANN
jgi:hypothetical protein